MTVGYYYMHSMPGQAGVTGDTAQVLSDLIDHLRLEYEWLDPAV